MSDHDSFFAITKTEPIDLDDEDIGLEPGVTFNTNSIRPVKQEYSAQGSALASEKRTNVGLSLTNLGRLPTLDSGSARAACPPATQNPPPITVLDDGVTSLEDYCRLLLRKYHPYATEVTCGECKSKVRVTRGTIEHASTPLSHAISHANIPRYQCQYCPFSCSSLWWMPGHLKERHGGAVMREGRTYIDQSNTFRRALLKMLIKCYGAYGEDLSDLAALDSLPPAQSTRVLPSVQRQRLVPPIKKKLGRPKGSSKKNARIADQQAISLDQWDGSSDLPALDSPPAQSAVSFQEASFKPKRGRPAKGSVMYARITDRWDDFITGQPETSTSVADIGIRRIPCRANPTINASPPVDHQSLVRPASDHQSLFRPANDRQILNPTTFEIDSASSTTVQIASGSSSLTADRCEQNRLTGPTDLCLELATKYHKQGFVGCQICHANISVPKLGHRDISSRHSMTTLLFHALEHFGRITYSCKSCSHAFKTKGGVYKHFRSAAHKLHAYTARCLGSQHQMMDFVRRCYDPSFKAIGGLCRPSEVASTSKSDGAPTAMATVIASGPISSNFAPESNVKDETPIVEKPSGKRDVKKMMRRHEPTISMVAKVAFKRWTKEAFECKLCRLVLRNKTLMKKHIQFCAGKR